MARTVTFCSKAEFDKLIITDPTIIFTLDDSIEKPREITDHDKGEHVTWHQVPCKVLDTDREFESTDQQAKTIGNFMKAVIKPDVNIVVQCNYGELRSPAVAYGLVALTSDTLTTYLNGIAIHNAEEDLRFDAFQARTAFAIADIFEGDTPK